ncbi:MULTISPECIES: 3'-5' exonuclease [unclassified Microbacterium]|uniref:3'-5' exonuclease n=1 Tax=unclassified Microbacterium TaxID=2609290 RepID=UPI00097EDE26|nr:3'-5' exonuclease [Microbacterium sp. JB110]RCS61893.1 DNA polymerase III subunit epsilon [Microbacterium sp. JB110]SJM66471.1 DNA polymerase III epsilon subunit [Frigoribacterium sp. JB110]
MPLDFTAIDFETANGSPASACQVGLARVRDGRVVETAGWLIRPPAGHDTFHPGNMGVHGIAPDDVLSAPGWTQQLAALVGFIGGDVLVAHSAAFDTRVLRSACEATGAELDSYRYLCSLQVARKVYDLPSYRLPIAAEAAGHHEFAHHEATADALACAQIVIDAGRRHEAADVTALARTIGAKVKQTEPVAPRAAAA